MRGIRPILDGKPKNVMLELGESIYDIAIQAHKQHRMVICEGVLLRMGRSSVLTKMNRFVLVPDTEQDQDAT
jgi:hypothetical protein